MTSPLPSIVFVTGPEARNIEVAIHILTIPPTQLGKSSRTFANRALRYRTKPELASLVRPLVPGEDLLLAAGGLI